MSRTTFVGFVHLCLFDKIDAASGRLVLTNKVLDYLAVHPDHRRQGIASMLVESGCREAEKLGLDIFVHAMKDGLGVHLRAGFELVEQIIQDDSKYGGLGEYANYFLVWRSAKTSTDGVDLAKEE